MEVRRISTWRELELEDLVYAYRKAKADCFFDRSLHLSQVFVSYEKELHQNLARLLLELREDGLQAVLARNFGEYRLVPKKLSKRRLDSAAPGHVYFSDPERAFEFLLKSEELTPEFRLVGVFSVELHVLSALWINLVGHQFDERLNGCVYGSRLRRYRGNSALDADGGRYTSARRVHFSRIFLHTGNGETTASLRSRAGWRRVRPW